MELDKVISNCANGVKYAVVGKEGSLEWKSQPGLLYADDVSLLANSEEEMKVIIEQVSECDRLWLDGECKEVHGGVHELESWKT